MPGTSTTTKAAMVKEMRVDSSGRWTMAGTRGAGDCPHYQARFWSASQTPPTIRIAPDTRLKSWTPAKTVMASPAMP